MASNGYDYLAGIKGSIADYLADIFTLENAISTLKNGMEVVKEFDSAMTSLAITMDTTTSRLSDLGNAAIDTAKSMGTSISQALDVSKIYANPQTATDEIIALSVPTIELANASGLDTETTSGYIQSVIKEFELVSGDSEHIADVFENISTNINLDFASGIKNIAAGVEAAGSIAHEAGMSFEEFSAIVAKTAETTGQEGSEIANQWKTILTRISRASASDAEIEPEVLENASESLHKAGIEVYNEDGNYNDVNSILSELSQKWNTFTDAQQSDIAYSLTASKDTDALTVALESYAGALELAKSAEEDRGTAAKNQEVWMDSYTAKLNQAGAEIDQLYISMLDNDLTKGAIEGFTGVLDIINKFIDATGDLGAALVGIGGMAGILKLGEIFEIPFLTTINEALSGLISTITSFPVSLPVAAAVGGAIAALALLSVCVTDAHEQMEKAFTAQQDYESTQSEIQSINSELETTTARINEIKAQENISLTDQQELDNLEKQNLLLQQQLEQKKLLADQQANQAAEEAAKAIDSYSIQDSVKKEGTFVDKLGEGVGWLFDKLGVGNLANAIGGLNQYDILSEKLDDYDLVQKQIENFIRDTGESKDSLDRKASQLEKDIDTLYTNLSQLSATFYDENGQARAGFEEEAQTWENFNTDYIRRTLGDKAADNDIITRTLSDDKYSDVINKIKELSSISLDNLKNQFPGLIEELEKAGVSVENIKAYFANLADPDSLNLDEVKKLLRDNFTKDDFELNPKAGEDAEQEWDDFIADCSEDDIKLMYSIMQSKDTKGWSIDDWLNHLKEAAGEAESLLDATPMLDAYTEATESPNEGDNYLKFAQALENAKEAYNAGLVGTDDFKTAAAMFSPTGMDDAANFEENYDRISRYFDTDSFDGVQAFLKDLEALDKGYAEFDSKTGTWTTRFDDLEQAAKDMGMGFEPFMSVLKRMADYGASNNFFSNIDEGKDHLSDLYRELAEEEMALAQLQQTDPNNKSAIDATQDKIDTLKASIQESIDYLEQLTNMQAEDFDAQVTGAKEAYNSLAEQRKNVLAEGGENASSVAKLIEDQMKELVTEYHLEIDAEGNIVEVEQPEETPEVKVKAGIETSTDIDLTNRPQASSETLKNSGWEPEIQQNPNNTDAETQETPDAVVTIDGDNTLAKSKVDEAVNYANSKTGYININASTATLGLTVQNALLGKTFFINVTPNILGGTTEPVAQKANGTPFIQSGTFNNGYLGGYFGGSFAAGGTVGEPKNIVALTGELGEEMVVRGNRFFTVGKNGPEMVHLKRGDIVFNHRQTKELLSKGHTGSRGKALAEGNARNGAGTNALKSSSGGSGKTPDTSAIAPNTDAIQDNTDSIREHTDVTRHSAQTFDWVAERLEAFADRTKAIADTITDYVTLAFKKAQLKKQMTAVNQEITANNRGASAYLKKANSVAKNYTYYDDDGTEHSISIPKKYKNLVKKGGFSIEDMDTSTDEAAALAKAVQSYQDYYDKAQDCKRAVTDLRKEQLKLYEDWINIPIESAEKKIDKYDSELNRLERDYSKLSVNNVSARNANLDAQTKYAKKHYKAYQKAFTLADGNADRAEKKLSATQKAFTAADKKKLTKPQRKALKKGTSEISTVDITDQSLLKKINAYNQALQKKTIADTAKNEALDKAAKAEQDYIETVQDNAQAKFDNIETMSENAISQTEHKKDLTDAQIDRAETQGYLVSQKYYETLRSLEASNLAELQKEKAALVASLNESVNSGAIKTGSEAWYDMQQQIDDVTLSIEDSTTAMLEYGNSIRDIEWEIFDLLQDRISHITDEADFLIDLMGNEKLYEDNGQLTDEGIATMGLHGLNYNVNMAQADKYAKEIAEIDQKLASGEYNHPYDQEVIDRRQELLELQQKMILAAEDEKEAISDMVSEGIDLELDALKELIDTYTDALDSQKDLYDYQKKVKDQTEEISSLEKQLAAYAGDTSEEARAKIQQIKVSLEDAKENLLETEYDHYISEQKQLLDDLYDEYEDILNRQLGDVDALIQDMIDAINDKSGTINSTITETAGSVGYTLSDEMRSIWTAGTGNITSVLTAYGNSFETALTTTNSTLDGIRADISNMMSDLDKEAGANNAGGDATPAKIAKTNDNGGDTSSGLPGSGEPVPNDDNTLKKVTDFISSLKKKSLTDKEVKSHSKLFQYIFKKSKGRAITNDAILRLGSILGVSGLPKKSANLTAKNKNAILRKLKAVGYRSGVKQIADDELAWTNENWERSGAETIIRKSDGAILTPLPKDSRIYNAMASENMWQMANSPSDFIRQYADNAAISISEVPSAHGSTQINMGDHTFSITLPNVKNYEEFKASMQKDASFEKFIQSITIDPLTAQPRKGKNRFNF